MTVSQSAQHRWFFYRIAFVILFCLFVFGSQIANAQTAIYDGGICKLANRSPEPVTSYRIIAETFIFAQFGKHGQIELSHIRAANPAGRVDFIGDIVGVTRFQWPAGRGGFGYDSVGCDGFGIC